MEIEIKSFYSSKLGFPISTCMNEWKWNNREFWKSTSAMKFHRNGLYFLLGVINLTSAALLAIAIGTPRWIQADILRKATQTNSNSTQLFFNAGNKYMGLFRGCETKNYGHLFGARYRCFNGKNWFFNFQKFNIYFMSRAMCSQFHTKLKKLVPIHFRISSAGWLKKKFTFLEKNTSCWSMFPRWVIQKEIKTIW